MAVEIIENGTGKIPTKRSTLERKLEFSQML
jgi:hypothetical protein